MTEQIRVRNNTFRRPFGGLGATYDVHFRFIGKRVVNFMLMLIELNFFR